MMAASKPTFQDILYPEKESNPHHDIRSVVFLIPLNYRGIKIK